MGLSPRRTWQAWLRRHGLPGAVLNFRICCRSQDPELPGTWALPALPTKTILEAVWLQGPGHLSGSTEVKVAESSPDLEFLTVEEEELPLQVPGLSPPGWVALRMLPRVSEPGSLTTKPGTDKTSYCRAL